MIPLVLLLPLVGSTTAFAFQNDDDDEEDGIYRGIPGLVTVWSDGTQTAAQTEARLAFSLAKDESPHPRISSNAFQGVYRGTLNIQRPGKYRFFVEVLGEFSLSINGKEILREKSVDSEPHSASSESIQVKYGPASVEAAYRKSNAGRSMLRLFWQREGEFRLPVSPGVLFHDAEHETGLLKSNQSIENGRNLVENRNCTACHLATPGELQRISLTPAGAPRLDNAGSRFYRNWIYHWLKDPHAFRPNTAMPRLFGDSQKDHIDLFAVTAYLSSLGDPLKHSVDSIPDGKKGDLTPDELQQTGRRTFAETGCIACHTALDEKPPAISGLRSLAGLASKTDRRGIAEAVLKPWKHHPDSRMPDFRLQDENPELLQTILEYLSSDRNRNFEAPPAKPDRASMVDRYRALIPVENRQDAFSKLNENGQWQKLGKLVLETRGCLNCHQLEAHKTRVKAIPDFAKIRSDSIAKKEPEGCLLTSQSRHAPDFQFSNEKRDSVLKYLALETIDVSTQAPVYEAKRTLQQLGCTACHQHNGRESLFAQRILQFTKLDSDQQLRDITPPELTAVGEKLKPDWIHAVVSQGKRARPWMDLKMPVFPKQKTATLSAQLVKSDGLPVEVQQVTRPIATEQELEAGRMLVGKTGFNCVSCHDIRGIESTGVRGPDMAGVVQRVRREWFGRWLLDPQQISPGTRMPTVFFAGRSAAPQYLNGDPQAQIEALWAYLSQGEQLKLPLMTSPLAVPIAGGENPQLIPKDRPILARGFLREHGGNRGIALGFPQGTHFGFDSQSCRLVSAWRGDFLELGGWYGLGRGGADKDYNKVLGNAFWHGPRSMEMTYAGKKPSAVRFLSCWTTKEDAGFSYQLHYSADEWITVEDRPAPLPKLTTPGFHRTMTFKSVPAAKTVGVVLHQRNGGDERPAEISVPDSTRQWWRVHMNGKPGLISVRKSPLWMPRVSREGIQLDLKPPKRPETVSLSVIYLQQAADDSVDFNRLEQALDD